MKDTSIFHQVNGIKIDAVEKISIRVETYRLKPIIEQIHISKLMYDDDIAFIFAYFSKALDGTNEIIIEAYINGSNDYDRYFTNPYDCFISVDSSIHRPNQSKLKNLFSPPQSLRKPLHYLDLPRKTPLIIRSAGGDYRDYTYSWTSVVVSTINDLLLIRSPHEEHQLFRFNEVSYLDENSTPNRVLVKNNQHWTAGVIFRTTWTPSSGMVPRSLFHRVGEYDVDSDYIKCSSCQKIQFLKPVKFSEVKCRECGDGVRTNENK